MADDDKGQHPLQAGLDERHHAAEQSCEKAEPDEYATNRLGVAPENAGETLPVHSRGTVKP